MSADQLRRAAELIEKFAAEATPGSWNGHISADGCHYGAVYGGPFENGYRMSDVMGWSEETVEEYGGEPSRADLNWLCLVSPHIAGPLAAWLRAEADSAYKEPAAVDLARAILAEEVRCQWCGNVTGLDEMGMLVAHLDVTEGGLPMGCAGAYGDDYEPANANPEGSS